MPGLVGLVWLRIGKGAGSCEYGNEFRVPQNAGNLTNWKPAGFEGRTLLHGVSSLVSQTASQPVSQLASQPVSKPVSQSVSQPASQPASQQASQSASKPARQSVSQSASQPAS